MVRVRCPECNEITEMSDPENFFSQPFIMFGCPKCGILSSGPKQNFEP